MIEKKRLLNKLILLALIAIALLVQSLLVPIIFKTPYTCIIRAITNVPCAGCGLTRAFLSLLDFDIKLAFYYHPLFIFIPIVIFIWLFDFIPLFNKIINAKWPLIALMVLWILIYIYRLIWFFSSNPSF